MRPSPVHSCSKHTPLHYDDVLLSRPYHSRADDGMPKVSPFKIILAPEEARYLEAIARRYTALYCEVIRAKIVLLAAQGHRNDHIAARLDLPPQIVTKWRKRFFHHRLAGLKDQPRRRPAASSTRRVG